MFEGKSFNRLRIFSKVDFRPRRFAVEESGLPHQGFHHLSLDENDIRTKMASLLSKPVSDPAMVPMSVWFNPLLFCVC